MAIKARALHHQVADEMRRAITKGKWTPGARIPTEDQLCQTYGVSKPTLRQAVAALRTEGLLIVQQGRGTYVRDTADQAPRTAIDRTVTRTSTAYGTNGDQWHNVEPPGISHVKLEPDAAETLALPTDDVAYLITRLLAHADTGARLRQTMLIPMQHVAGTPLAQPDATITTARAYAALSTAHGPLQWTETVSARQPTPDERAALRIDIAPLLISRRITRTQDGHRPLMVETTTLPGDTAELTYTIRPTRPASKDRRE